MKDTIEYGLISLFYNDRTTVRSRVPLMDHIVEGVMLLLSVYDVTSSYEHSHSLSDVQKAYCIHPLLQEDKNLKRYHSIISQVCDPTVVLLATEYRNIANSFLSTKLDDPNISKTITKKGLDKASKEIKLSPIDAVNYMLIADKIQNYTDFMIYHKSTHPRSKELYNYFRMWFERLGIKLDIKKSETSFLYNDREIWVI